MPGHRSEPPTRQVITLITCTPITLDFTPWRIVVTGVLVSVKLNYKASHRARVVTSFDLARPVWANRARLEQVVINLLLNAAQAMPDGGELTIQAAHEAREVCLSLIDTGTGMTPDVLNRLFRPFFSTKAMICASSPPVEWPMIAGFLSSPPITSAV